MSPRLVPSILTTLTLLQSSMGYVADSDMADIRRLAPIVWPARSEPAYPMLPNPFAFDGIDNNCDGHYDLDDPAEVAPELPIARLADLLREARSRAAIKDRSGPSWDCTPGEWRAYGRDRAGTWQFGPQPRVLFVGPLDRGLVERWNVDHAADPPSWNSRIPVRTSLIQYWFYYPFDIGPNAHLDDAEHVSVFVERNETAPSGRLRAIVGAGHEVNNVNNMLVADAHDSLPRTHFLLPPRLPKHMPVLIELGKHASAPDVNCDGRFDLGADSNVYAESAWGSRDLWAGSKGKALKVGRFQAWYSFPRSMTDRLLVDDWWHDIEEFKEHATACPDLAGLTSIVDGDVQDAPADALSMTRAALDRLPSLQDPAWRKQQAHRVGLQTYQLFRVRDLYDLHNLLVGPACVEDETCAQVVQEMLGERRQQFWGSRDDPATAITISPGVARRLRAWAMARDPGGRRRIWENEAFRKPRDDFRPWLFHRVGLGVEVGRSESGSAVLGAILRIADVPYADSRLEFYAYFDNPWREGRMQFQRFGFDYHPSRASLVGTYFGLGYARSAERRLVATAGVEVYAPNLPWIPKWPRTLSVSAYGGITAQVLRTTQDHELKVSDGLVLLQESDPVRVQFGLRLVFGFLNPRHPLER